MGAEIETREDRPDTFSESEVGEKKLIWGLYEDSDGTLVFQFNLGEIRTTRRAFLELLAKAGGMSLLMAYTLETSSKEFLENFWPDSLQQYERRTNLSPDLLMEFLTEQQVENWTRFKEKSTQMLVPDPDSVYDVTKRDLHLTSVFFRDLDPDFYDILTDAIGVANSVSLYILDPLDHRAAGRDLSALEHHEAIELEMFRDFAKNKMWWDMYAQLNNAVPHPNSHYLNWIRALVNASRAIQSLVFFNEQSQFNNVLYMDSHRASLRARIVGDQQASFVVIPKGTIGTTKPTAGMITNDSDLIGELKSELKKRTKGRARPGEHPMGTPRTTANLLEDNEKVLDRARTHLQDAHACGEVTSEEKGVINDYLNGFEIRSDVRRELSTVETWSWHDDCLRNRIDSLTAYVNDILPFEKPDEISEFELNPNAMYAQAEQIDNYPRWKRNE